MFNGEADLPGLLSALSSQTADSEDYEVVVVDDASTDATEAVAKSFAGVRVLRSTERRGSYAARNLGVKATTGDVVAFTDADCRPARDWIARGATAIADADLVAGRVDVEIGTPPTITSLIDAVRFLDQRRYVDDHSSGATANLWVKRAVLESLGGFQGRLISGGDTEFGQRATAAGYRLRYADDVVVAHPARRRPRQLATKAFRLGYGAAQHRHHAEGELAQRRPVWQQPGMYLPRGRFKDVSRITRQGFQPRRRDRIAMFWLQYAALRLPRIAGDLTGSVVEGRRRSRGGAVPRLLGGLQRSRKRNP